MNWFKRRPKKNDNDNIHTTQEYLNDGGWVDSTVAKKADTNKQSKKDNKKGSSQDNINKNTAGTSNTNISLPNRCRTCTRYLNEQLPYDECYISCPKITRKQQVSGLQKEEKLQTKPLEDKKNHEYIKNLINELKFDLCSNCTKFQNSCPYQSDGKPLSGCDQYIGIAVGIKRNITKPIDETPGARPFCPSCGSFELIKAYGERFECKKCHRIFT